MVSVTKEFLAGLCQHMTVADEPNQVLIDQAGETLVEFEATIKVHLNHQPTSSATPGGVCQDEEVKMYEKERMLTKSQDDTAKRVREPPLSEAKKYPNEDKMVANMID